ncbi:MAG: DUF3800 domain-containing protein [Thermodesulfobacteriota bacterium]|jgi:hypothetical protein
MSSPTFVVYVDESGDEGFSFGRGSSEWFVLSAVIIKKATELETVKLVDRIRTQLQKPEKKPLHFRDLKHEQRLPFIGEISKAHLRTVSVITYKPSIKEPEKFHERFRLYYYTVRYLLERVSWYCRDHKLPKDSGDGSAQIIFSNRSGMSYQEMKEYLGLLKDQTRFADVRIAWNVINPDKFMAYSPGKNMGLQIADAVASSVFFAVQPSRYGFIEDRYIRMLKPVVYHHEGKYRGYGLKFWPREMDHRLETAVELEWLRIDFK